MLSVLISSALLAIFSCAGTSQSANDRRVVSKTDDLGRTYLHAFSLTCSVEFAADTLSRGADPNARDKEGATPLHYATINNCTEIVRLLLNAGADPEAKSEKLPPPLVIAMAKQSIDIAELLIAHGASPVHNAQGFSPLHMAAAKCRLSFVKLLLEKGMDANAENDSVTPLMLASSCKESEVVQLLLKSGASLDKVTLAGATMLHIAALNGSAKNVRLLLELGMNPAMPDNEGRIPADYAALWNHTELADLLYEEAKKAIKK
jgi:ankyrin repeat protein